MSQAGSNGSGGGGGSGIKFIDGNTGTATGITVTFTNGGIGGGTPRFNAGGSTVTLDMDIFASGNLGLGTNSLGRNLTIGSNNTGIGTLCGFGITSGSSNTGVGSQAIVGITTGNDNTALGTSCLGNVVTGSFSTCLGNLAGSNYTTSESSNICIGHNVLGTIGESNMLRIGVSTGTGAGQINQAFIQGIAGRSTANSETVSINTTTGQLGSYPVGGFISLKAIDFTDSPYTVIASDVYLSVDATGGAITIRLPNVATSFRTLIIKDSVGISATNNITVTTVGGVVTIDGATSFVMNTAYESIQLVFNGSTYEVY